MNILKSINKIESEENLKKFEQLQSKLDFEITQDVKEVLIDYNVAKPLRTFYKKEKVDYEYNGNTYP